MKHHLLLSALLVAGFTAASDAEAGDDWKAAFEVKAKQAGETLSISVTPKEGYYVNSLYPMKLELSSEEVKLAKAKLGKKDAKFEASELEGKAKLCTFEVGAKGKGKVDGTYKLSICTKSGCSPPLKGTFASK